MSIQLRLFVIAFPLGQAKLRSRYREPMAQKAETTDYLVLIEKVCQPLA